MTKRQLRTLRARIVRAARATVEDAEPAIQRLSELAAICAAGLRRALETVIETTTEPVTDAHRAQRAAFMQALQEAANQRILRRVPPRPPAKNDPSERANPDLRRETDDKS